MTKNSNELQQRIDKYKDQKQPIINNKNGNMAFNIAIELVAAAGVGIIVGLIFDYLFDSSPISLIICMLLSYIAALKSIWNKYLKKNA